MNTFFDYINRNKSYITLIVTFFDFLLLLLLIKFCDNESLVNFWLISAIGIFVLGSLTFILIPILYLNHLITKDLFKGMNKQIDISFFALIITNIIGSISFIIICYREIQFPPVFFSIPGFMFAIITLEKFEKKIQK